jgi:NAD(P)-dependent dehydrogenase (short-subunit alcohol dehydrogenase family)
MNVQGSTVLITGANRGIGKAYVEGFLEAGAARIYATARSLAALEAVGAMAPDRIIPLALDVTRPEEVAVVAQQAPDVNILINNAGVLGAGGLFTDQSVETAQWEMQTNYFGTLSMVRAFAPVLKRNGGGAIVNLLSIVSVVNAPVFSSYSASKAALYSLTQGVRAELAKQGTHVIGVFPGPVDTAMAEGVPMDKVAPIAVAQATIRAIAEQIEEVYPDPTSQHVFAHLQSPLKEVEREFAGMLPQ